METIFKNLEERKAMRLRLVSFSLILLVTFSLNIISAVPPVQSTIVAPEGLEIEATNFKYLKQNTYQIFRFRVYNATNNVFLNDTHVNCSMGIINDMGDYIYNQPTVTATGYVFIVNVTGGNFSELGIYHQGINCITNNGITAGGVKTLSFEVIPSGFNITVGLYIILLILSMGIVILGFYIQDNWVIVLGGFAMIIVGLLTLFYGIAEFKDAVYTWSIGLITLMLGAYFSIRGSVESLS